MNEAEVTNLSRLCDGELDNEELVHVLLNVFDDSEARDLSKTEGQRILCDLLRLRQQTGVWRNQEAVSLAVPPTMATNASEDAASTRSEAVRPATESAASRKDIARRMAWPSDTAAYLAISVCSALLVLTGVMVGQRLQSGNLAPQGTFSPETFPLAAVQPEQVPAERRQQLAQVFAFHESVAGPLNWYAAGEDAEALAIAGSEPQAAPVGIILRFTTRGPQPKSREYVIVCRDRAPASIRLPGSGLGDEPVQIRLTPTAEYDSVQLQYCVVLTGGPDSTEAMGLSGRRAVGAGLKELGEFASDRDSIRIEASAWVLEGAGA